MLYLFCSQSQPYNEKHQESSFLDIFWANSTSLEQSVKTLYYTFQMLYRIATFDEKLENLTIFVIYKVNKGTNFVSDWILWTDDLFFLNVFFLVLKIWHLRPQFSKNLFFFLFRFFGPTFLSMLPYRVTQFMPLCPGATRNLALPSYHVGVISHKRYTII